MVRSRSRLYVDLTKSCSGQLLLNVTAACCRRTVGLISKVNGHLLTFCNIYSVLRCRQSSVSMSSVCFLIKFYIYKLNIDNFKKMQIGYTVE